MRRLAGTKTRTRGPLILVLFMVAAITFPALSHASVYEPQVTVTEALSSYESQWYNTYSVTNNQSGASVYSVLIGNKWSWGSLESSSRSDWGFKTMIISFDEETSNRTAHYLALTSWWVSDPSVSGGGYSETGYKSVTVFQNLPAAFASYEYAFLFYALRDGNGAARGIAPGETGVFKVQTSGFASPFIWTAGPIDLSNIPPGGYSYDGPGDSTHVPLPSALLLFVPGLAGVFALRKKLK